MFEACVTTLEEVKDRSRISIEELVCLFQDHELQIYRYDEEISSLENMVQWKVFDNWSPSTGIINISGEAPRNMLSPDNIYKPTSPVQTTFDYSLFCLMAECDPVTFEEASEESKWNKAMDEEIGAIKKNMELTMMRCLLQLHELTPSDFLQQFLLRISGRFIRWM